MKLFSILSFICLAAVAILPSASALEKTAHVRRHTSTTKSNNKDRPDVRALQGRFSEVLAATKAKAPQGGAVATESHHQRSRELQEPNIFDIILDIILGIFGIGDEEEGDDGDDGEGGDLFELVLSIIDILIPALTGGESDDLVMQLLAAILPFLLETVFGDNPLLDFLLGLIGGYFGWRRISRRKPRGACGWTGRP